MGPKRDEAHIFQSRLDPIVMLVEFCKTILICSQILKREKETLAMSGQDLHVFGHCSVSSFVS